MTILISERERSHEIKTLFLQTRFELEKIKSSEVRGNQKQIQVPDISNKDWVGDMRELFGKEDPNFSEVLISADFSELTISLKTTKTLKELAKKIEDFFEKKYPAFMSAF